MRVILLCTGLNDLGGANRHLAVVFKGLKLKGIDVRMVCSSSKELELKDFFYNSGIPQEKIHFLPRINKLFFVPMVMSLNKIFREFEPDIVHCFNIQSDIFCGLASGKNPKHYLISHYESKPLTENSGWIKNTFYKIMNKIVRPRFSKNLVVSEGIKKETLDMQLCSSSLIEVVYIGIEPPRDMAKQLKFLSPVIGTVARFSPEKGLERIVQSAPLILKEIPSAVFLLVGDGDDKPRLLELAKFLGIEHKVIFRDWQANPLKIIEDIDIYVMPSLREGCPTALLEALALARPVVASNIPGINEIIRHGQDGILVDTADTAELSEAVITLCQDPLKAESLGLSGQQRVLNNFTIEKEIQSILNTYENISRS